MATTPHAEPPTIEAYPSNATQQQAPAVWFLSEAELSATRAKIAALTKRAQAKGFNGSIHVAATTATRNRTPAPGAPPVIEHGYDVMVIGDPPRFDHWRFLAAVDALGAAKAQTAEAERSTPQLVVRYAPGAATEVDVTSVRPGTCDHCHTSRPRSTTVLVEHVETGEVRQIGRSCLKDFLGHSALPVLITDDDIGATMRRAGSTGTTVHALVSVLTYAWAVVETYGWTPANAGGERPASRDLVADAMRGGKEGRPVLSRIADKLDEGREIAPRIIAELEAALTATSGYEANQAAIIGTGEVGGKHLGLAVSAVRAWHRLNEPALASTDTRQPATPTRHVGAVGDKVQMAGTVTKRVFLDSYEYNRSPQVLLIVECEEAVAKLITAAGWAMEVKEGDRLTVQGTVKAHEMYRGVAQTRLVRPRKLADPCLIAPAPGEAAHPTWENVAPISPRSRFQETPLAADSQPATAMTF